MKTQFITTRLRQVLALSIMVMLVLPLGCSSCRFPKIDPSGNSIFLPCSTPGQPVAPMQTAPISQDVPLTVPPIVPTNPVYQVPTLSSPPAAPQYSPSQPAFEHPPTPPPCNDPTAGRHAKKHLVPNPKGRKSAGQRGQIIMTPSRIVAPVGSEVVVLAGICGEDGFFVTNQPLEWMLSNNSVGEIIEVGGMNHSIFNRLVPPTSKKISGQYAKGRTGLKHIVLTRGTPLEADDIELKKGQTFISVASASPGTSYVTGYAPKAEGWDKRRTSTSIHWVDGHWSVPIPSQATAGTVHAMTTIVNRTDGSGMKGWQVRYSVVGGVPAEFAPAGSQTAETETAADGRATVQIRQPAGKTAPGITRVRVDVVRPPVFGEPELVVESGITTVTWSAPALTIRAIANRESKINEPFNYRIEITNPGDQIARGVVVRSKNIDQGIEFISSSPKLTEYGRTLEWQLGDIAPGSPPRLIEIQMKSKKLGNVGMCFEVASETDGLLTEACSEIEIVPPCIGFKIEGPMVARVGERVTFRLNVENLCRQPLDHLRMQVDYDMGLVRPGDRSPAIFENRKSIQSGQKDSVTITFVAQAPGTQCFNVIVTADGIPAQQERRCIKVDPANGAAPGLGNNAAPGNSTLHISLKGTQTVAVGGGVTVEARITNRGPVALDNVMLTNRFSSSIEPNGLTEPYDQRYQLVEGQNEMLVSIGTIPAGQTIVVQIGYAGVQVDPNASTEITVSSATETGESASLDIRVIAAGNEAPNFGAGPPGVGGGGIGIPPDGAAPPQRGKLSVSVRSMTPNIAIGGQARFEFSVVNNSLQPLKDVDVRPLIPNTMTLVQLFSEDRRPLRADGNIDRILELRSNEELVWVAILQCNAAGPATFGVQVLSADTVGESAASDVVQVGL